MTFKFNALLIAVLSTVSLSIHAQNIAVVNGKPIPNSKAENIIKRLPPNAQANNPQVRQMIREELINRELLLQEADKLGISNTPEIKEQLEMTRQMVILRALAEHQLKKNPITDADIKAEYDKFKSQASDKEYHLRHILVEKEEEAKNIITKLKGGSKFEDLAKQLSKDKGSASNGGDLDWAMPGTFVKPFSDAATKLQKGAITETPVKTQFGYHIIRLEDTRTSKIPTLEEVKPQIMQSLQQQRLQKYQTELREKAKIQ